MLRTKIAIHWEAVLNEAVVFHAHVGQKIIKPVSAVEPSAACVVCMKNNVVGTAIVCCKASNNINDRMKYDITNGELRRVFKDDVLVLVIESESGDLHGGFQRNHAVFHVHNGRAAEREHGDRTLDGCVINDIKNSAGIVQSIVTKVFLETVDVDPVAAGKSAHHVQMVVRYTFDSPISRFA